MVKRLLATFTSKKGRQGCYFGRHSKSIFQFSDTNCATLNEGETADHAEPKKMDPFDEDIEITSWKARAYGIFTRVGEVSEIERVRAANE